MRRSFRRRPKQDLDHLLDLGRQHRRLIEQVEDAMRDAEASRQMQREAVGEPRVVPAHLGGLVAEVAQHVEVPLEPRIELGPVGYHMGVARAEPDDEPHGQAL